MKKHTRYQPIYIPALVLCALATAAVFWGLPHLTTAEATLTPAGQLAQIWENAAASGRYAFDSHIDQTIYPAPSLTNAGRPPEQTELALAGQVDQPNEIVEFTLWQGVQGLPEQGLTIRTENGRSQQRFGAGEWETIQQNSDLFTPNNDPLTFLTVAANVEAAGEETRQFGEQTLTYSRYTFEIDTAAYSTLMRQRLQEQMAHYGTLPAGLTLQTPEIYRQMTGRGQLWVDGDGLPVRLTVDLEIPPQSNTGRTVATFTSDFHSYDRSRLAQVQLPFWENPQNWLMVRESAVVDSVRHALLISAVLSAAVAFTLLVLTYWHTERFQTAVTVLVVFAIVAPPLLQARQAHAFQQNWSQARAEQAAERAETEQLTAAQEQLRQPNFDPHQSVEEQRAVQDTQSATNLETAAMALAPAAATQSTSTDTDGDGLSDSDEDVWRTCAYLGAPNYCDGVSDSTDSDGDGLKDGIEVYNLTTHPARWDTDADSLSDGLEVNGFFYSGKTWYLNPNESDSNKDGLVDTVECTIWNVNDDNYDPNAACPDSDGDGTPDVWDDDNDNDDVPDAVDLSAFQVGEQVYTHDAPMTLQVNGLEPDLPIFVDVQLRPEEADHLGYIGTVLDWPSGDTAGQIQRRLDTTFATTSNSDIQDSGSFAANGDVRLVPMAEIVIPYTAGHYGNLPVKTSHQGVPRTLDMVVADWLDTSKLEPYGISVRDAGDGSGDLIVYMPLAAVLDDTNGGRAAYTFRMLYWPGQTNGQNEVDWAAAHELRVLWMVQMITDDCIDETADPATCSRQDLLEIIHVYKENWTLTGLDIREDHGLNVGILYEDPAQDDDTAVNDALWAASWNLNNQFLSGQDCDTFTTTCSGDGQRDVTLANLPAKIGEWSGDTDPIEVSTFSYDHRDFVTHIMMTETVNLLDAVFAPAGVTDPTLMFAREETYRSGNLGQAVETARAFTVDMTDSPELVMANMSWMPYAYFNGGWQTADLEQALDSLRQQLGQDPFFQAADDSQDSLDDAAGKLIWAELYYAAMVQGLSAAVTINDNPLWTAEDLAINAPGAQWPASTFSGAATIAFAYLEIFSRLSNDTLSGRTLWQQLSTGFSESYSTKALNNQFSSLGTATNILFAATTVAAVTGMTLFAIGYLSGDAKLQRIGEIILNATTIVMVSVTMVNLAVGLYAANAVANSLAGLDAMLTFSKANRSMGTIGIVIQFAVIWGSFAYVGLSSGLFNHPNQIGFNMALAYAIAQTIVLIILIVIQSIPIIGTFIVLAIVLVEAILSFFDIDGAQTWLTEKIAETLYDVDVIIRNMGSADRLDYTFQDLAFLNDAAGFTTAQVVTYSMVVTNVLKYAGGHGPDAAKKATFRYFLQDADIDRHEALSLNEMNNEWSGAGNKKIETSTTVILDGGGISFASVGTGINQDLGGHLYLSEAFASPYVGCWRVVGFNTNCTTYSFDGTTHIDVGEFSIFDILPSTLKGFHSLLWNNGDQAGMVPFPAQIDQDGDGLTRNTDPFPREWDGDGDGLSDYYELANGLKATSADSDGDGLTDSEELRRGLSPYHSDLDGDGLNDLTEWEGWAVVYDYDEAGDPLLTWVWPDPFQADADADRLTDEEERFYALHPFVASSEDAILETIQFSEGAVDEVDAPELLLRFDEPANASSFLDNAADTRATCTGDTCPTAGENGRYNHGLLFDGTNDYLTAPMEINPGSDEFTAAAWFKLSELNGSNQTILQQANGTFGTSRVWLYVLPSGKLATSLSGSGITVNQSFGADEWHHAAVTYDGVTLSLYLDGQLGISEPRTLEASDGDLLVGIDQFLSGRPFDGTLDEVAVYDTALDADGIADLAAARYNVSDLVVAPGDTIDLQLTISNTNPVYPAQVVYYGEPDNFTNVEAISPTFRVRMNEGAGATSFEIEGTGLAATCNNGAGECPTAGVAGYEGTALSFDGNDVLNVDPILQNYSGDDGFTLSFWFNPDVGGGNSFNQVLVNFLDNNGGINRDDTRLLLTYSSTDDNCCGTSGGEVPPGNWYNYTISYNSQNDTISRYLNGNTINESIRVYNIVAGDRLRLGGPQAPDWSFDAGFEGLIDDLIFYDRPLTEGQLQVLLAGDTPEFPILPDIDTYTVGTQNSIDISALFTIPEGQPSGIYIYSQLAEAALDIPDQRSVSQDPIYLLHFDEPIVGASNDILRGYPDQQINCYGTGCVTVADDFAGKAGVFNGSDNSYGVGASVAAPTGAWTMSAWVYPTHADATARGIIGSESLGLPALFLTADDKLGFAFDDGSSWNSDYTAAGSIPRNQWSQVGATYDGQGNYQLYLNGQPIGDDALIEGLTPTFGPGRVGDVGASYELFQGRMDNVVIYDVVLSDAQMVTLHGTEDLSLHLHYTLDEPPGSNVFTDNAGIFGDGTCTNCPILGIRGAVNRAAYFEGDQIRSLANAPDHWRSETSATEWALSFWLKAEYGQVIENRGTVLPVRVWTNKFDYGRDCNSCGFDEPTAPSWPAPDPTEWTHIVLSFDNDDSQIGGIFVNGEQIQGGGSTIIYDLFNNSPFRVGAGSLKGYVDDVRLYGRALTADEAVQLYEQTRPQLQYEFEEDGTAGSTVDQSPNDYTGTIANAIPGLAGRIGNGVDFNGDGVIDAGAATNINGITETLTIMTWIRPDQETSDPQLIVGSGLDNSVNGFGFGIQGSALWFSDGTTTVSSGDIGLILNTWQQVAVKVGSDGTVTFYLDGNQVGSNGVVSLVANTDDNLYLGGRPQADSSLGEQFYGQMDELFIYARALPSPEIAAAYDNQFRWFRKQFDTSLIVDNDVPTITLQTTQTHWPNGYVQLAVSTADATSTIWSFEMGLQAPSDGAMSWQAAPACGDVSFGTVWCPNFDPSTLDGEGVYQLQFRAVDTVGNETTSQVYTLYIDETAPVISSDNDGSFWSTLTPMADTELGWLLPLSGTVIDPSGVAASGVYTPSVMVQLMSHAGRPIGEAQQVTFINDTMWILDYELFGRPHGRFSVEITAEDNVGNRSTTTFTSELLTEGSLKMDARPPSVNADAWLLPAEVINQPLTLSGIVSELPAWGDAVGRYHFEETSGTTFYDDSTLDNHADCTNCPSGTAGLFGQALQFDGVDDTVTTPFLFNPVTTTFSVAVWFNADSGSAGQGGRALLQQGSVGGPGRTLLYLDANDRVRSNLGIGTTGTFAAPTAIDHDSWQHAVLTFDGTEARIFLNGRLAQTHTVIAENTQGGLFIGSSFGSSGFFTGLIDEVMVFERVLSASEIEALATSETTGAAAVDVWLEPFNFDGALSTPDWQPAVVNDPLSNLSTWEYTLPSGLEDFYQINVRGADGSSNMSSQNTVWRGIIDMVAPTVSVSAQHIGGGSAAQTEITFAAADRFLDMDNFDVPCDEITWQTTSYQADIKRIDGVNGTCRVSGHLLDPITINACDLGGQCSADVVTLAASPQVSSVAIVTPTLNATLAGSSLTVPIGGQAYDPDGIIAVALQINNNEYEQVAISGSPTDVTWTMSDWQPLQSGTYTLTAVMTDTLNATVTDTINVYVDVQTCQTEYTGDDVTDFASEDASALRMAVAAAPAGSTIKIAGVCAGVQGDGVITQTVEITKPLTLIGGYAQDGDWGAAEPDLYETVLDAEQNGRVVTIIDAGEVTLENLTLTGGYAFGPGSANPVNSGGGVYQKGSTLTLENMTIRNNYAQWYGAGLYTDGDSVTVRNSDIISNTHPDEAGSEVRRGGGIFMQNNGALTMTHSTVAYNESQGGGGIYAASGTNVYLAHSAIHNNESTGHGGGLFVSGDFVAVNSTISGNAGTIGGALRLTEGGTADFTFMTIVSNTGASGLAFDGAATLSNSIVAYHTADCSGAIAVDGGYNLVDDGSCGITAGTSQANIDPLLRPLAQNGGLTATHLPSLVSPALDAIPINSNGCGTDVTNDQRGVTRPKDNGCDIGAVEGDPNSVPVAVSDGYAAVEDTVLTVAAAGVLANDSDGDGHDLAAVLAADVLSGTLDLASNGAFTYTGAADFCGTDQFSYYANDGYVNSEAVTVTLTVACTNDDPVALPNSYTIAEDTPNSVLDVLDNDSDVDGDGLTVSDIGVLSAGGWAVNNGSAIDYTPATDFFGTETFTYTVADGFGGEATAAVTVTVTAVNDDPVAVNDGAETDENTAVEIYVLANDSDVEGDTLTISAVSQGSGGSVVNNGDHLVYTPDNGFQGSDTFTYTIGDGNGGSDTAFVTVLVAVVNTPPTAEAGGPYTVSAGESVTLDGSGTIDAEQEPITLIYAWDLDEDGLYDDATGMTTTFSALTLQGLLTVTVGLQVTDAGGLVSEDTAVVTIVANQYNLSVALAGDGNGSVMSNPSGIECGTRCSAIYPENTLVTLTALPSEGSIFSGWDGACVGEMSATCEVMMNRVQTVIVSFEQEMIKDEFDVFLPLVRR